MKKFYNSPARRRKFLDRKLRLKVKRRRRLKTWQKIAPKNPNTNRIENIHRKFQRQVYISYRRPHQPRKFKTVTFPRNFSFLNNTDNVLASLQEARRHFSKGHQVNFDMTHIEALTPETIALFLAHFKDKNFRRGLNVRGNTPLKPDLMKILVESGFFEFVKVDAYIAKNAKNILLNKITDKKVENETAREVCLNAVKSTFSNEKKFRPIYEILIECMANTKNHADASGVEGKFNWWIFEYTDPITNVTSFTFLDLGTGIFNSLPVKTFIRNITSKLGFTSNVDLVNDLVGGRITSKTGKEERGLGLPLIYHHSKNPFIRNFTIISNDVYANLEKDAHKKLNYNFAGTFLYWELHPESK